MSSNPMPKPRSYRISPQNPDHKNGFAESLSCSTTAPLPDDCLYRGVPGIGRSYPKSFAWFVLHYKALEKFHYNDLHYLCQILLSVSASEFSIYLSQTHYTIVKFSLALYDIFG